MKNKLKNYFLFISIVSIFLFLLGGNSSVVAAKGIEQANTTAQQSEKAIAELKQRGEYVSLTEAFRQARIEDGQAEDLQSRYTQQTKLTATDGTFDDNFGVRVAISGDTAVIGAYHDDIGQNADQGSAYVFVRSASGVWTQQAKLTASDGAAGDVFGCSVAIANTSAPSQTVIMVGAYGNDAGGAANRGAVYIFVRATGGTTWTSNGKLTASDGLANDVFGNSVAMTGSFAIIGSNGKEVGSTVDAGAAYIFVRSGSVWQEEQKLTSSIPLSTGNFGWSVDISGTLAVVGINYQGNTFGSVEVFERVSGGNTWVNRDRITGGGKFGYSVAISGDTFVAGAYDLNATAPAQGAAGIYRLVNGTWTNQGTIYASDLMEGDNFGKSVDISGDTIVVGADGDDNGGATNQGAAYIFTRSATTFTQQQKITDSAGAIGDQFGWSVAISDDTVIVGAFQDDIGQFGQQGSVSVFKLSNGSVPFDYDGDGKSDVSLFRPTNGYWYLNNSTTGFTYTGFGISGDQIAPADYDGDGKTDLAVFRPSNGAWYLLRSSLGFTQIQFGASGDLPMPADFDGDGKAEIAIFRPSTGVWYTFNVTNNQTTSIAFGITGDTPTAADYDGDGKADIAVFRPSSGTWYLNRSQLGFTAIQFGANGDKAVPGDYDADGKADLAVWRPSTGVWYLQQSQNGFSYAAFGIQNDLPAPADYDGDGKTDLGIFRPSSGTWYLQRSTQGFTQIQFGANGDKPTPNAFVP